MLEGAREGGEHTLTHTHLSPSSSSSSASASLPLPLLTLRPLFSQDGDAALHRAAPCGHTGAVKVLLQAKADVNLKSKVWVPGVCFGME